MKYNTQNNFSSFWLGDTLQNKSLIKDENTTPGVDYIRLAGYQRAIANFVNIVTSKNIPVKFSKRGDSYTDGKIVTISSKLDDKLFDSAVGLALHEGSHILLSDFDFLKTLSSSIPKTTFELGLEKGLDHKETISFLKNMLNYVEDRRIDNYIVSTSPGYKGYYLSMYDKYFNSPSIDKGLKSDEFTEPTLDAYMFRIINLTNPNTNLNALPGLKDIWRILDLRNISRLTSTGKAWEISHKIGKIVLSNLPVSDKTEKYKDIKKKINQVLQQSVSQSSLDNHDMVSDASISSIKDIMDRYQDSADYKRMLERVQQESVYLNDDYKVTNEINKIIEELNQDMSQEDKSDLRKKLDNALDKQRKFLQGDISKRKLSKKDSEKIKAVSESGATLKKVLTDSKYQEKFNNRWKNNGDKEVLIIKNLTQSLIDSNLYPSLLDKNPWKDTQQRVNTGLRLGKMLGKKLQIRGEERLLKNSRLNSGRIDKRLIAELGFGNSNVFHTIDIDRYADGFLHISLDASGSMSGNKFDNALICAVAIIQAVDMIPNFDVVFSLRGTTSGRGYGNELPTILIAYDSRVDNIAKVRKLFRHLYPGGTTPEGLCYEAIMKDMVETNTKVDSYFLNLSDGMPMFGNDSIQYYGIEALNHTKDMVNKMRKMGINILSYFITDTSWKGDINDFRTMYGSEAKDINILSITDIAKTMNKMFLKK